MKTIIALFIALAFNIAGYASDFRAQVEEKLSAAITANDAEASLKWASTLHILEQHRVVKAAGDAIIPVLNGYASITKEARPLLESAGPLLKFYAKQYLTSRIAQGVSKWDGTEALEKKMVQTLSADTPEEFQENAKIAITAVIDSTVKGDVEYHNQMEENRLREEQLQRKNK